MYDFSIRTDLKKQNIIYVKINIKHNEGLVYYIKKKYPAWLDYEKESTQNVYMTFKFKSEKETKIDYVADFLNGLDLEYRAFEHRQNKYLELINRMRMEG